MKHECKVCHAAFITRDSNNFYCKSCTREFQQGMTLQVEGAIAKEKAFRLAYLLDHKARRSSSRAPQMPGDALAWTR